MDLFFFKMNNSGLEAYYHCSSGEGNLGSNRKRQEAPDKDHDINMKNPPLESYEVL